VRLELEVKWRRSIAPVEPDIAEEVVKKVLGVVEISVRDGGGLIGSGFASPIGSFGSRSPSPTIGGQGRKSLLLSIPQQQHQQQALSGSPPKSSNFARPAASIQTANASPSQPPSLITPTSAYFSAADESETASLNGSEPPTATRERSPSPLPISPTMPLQAEMLPDHSSRSPQLHPTTSPSSRSIQQPPPLGLGSPLQPISPSTSSPHSPIGSASKRLSFVSYADLLTSTPTSTIPLASLTTAASAVEPPPHITCVAGLSGPNKIASHPGSAGTSLKGFVINPHPLPHHSGDPFSCPTYKNKRDSIALIDEGGEWEREGLGKGLEERLDVLYGTAPTAATSA